MEILLIVASLALSYWGLNLANAKGSWTAKSEARWLCVAALLVSFAMWMLAMGPLRGGLAYLGLVGLVGMVVSYINRPAQTR